MVEVAIALPFLIVIVIALVDMGIVFASYLSSVNATREGAIFASEYSRLVDSTCGSTPNPTCVGANDNIPFGSTGATSSTIWSEYTNRVANDVFVPLGETLRRNGLLDQDILTIDRPVIGSSPIPPCPQGSTTALDAGCPITVTVHFRLHTLTSDISLPSFGRFGLPNYYQINYSMGIPIR